MLVDIPNIPRVVTERNKKFHSQITEHLDDNGAPKTGVLKNGLVNTLKNNTIKCKNIATIVSGRKNVARPFVRRKQVSTSAEM